MAHGSMRAVISLMETLQKMDEQKRHAVISMMKQLAKSANINMDSEEGMTQLINKLIDSMGGEDEFLRLTSQNLSLPQERDHVAQTQYKMPMRQSAPLLSHPPVISENDQQSMANNNLRRMMSTNAPISKPPQSINQFPPAQAFPTTSNSMYSSSLIPPPLQQSQISQAPLQEQIILPQPSINQQMPFSQAPAIQLQQQAPKFDFTSLLAPDSNGDLGLHFKPMYTLGVDGDEESLHGFYLPIGIGYVNSETTPRILICDTKNNKVRVYTDNNYSASRKPSNKPQIMEKGGNRYFSEPSAIAVSRSGRIFAIKDNSTILIYDAISGKFLCNAASTVGQDRFVGLGSMYNEYEDAEYVCTIVQQKGKNNFELQTYKVDPSQSRPQLVWRHSYNRMLSMYQTVYGEQINTSRIQPCFLAINGLRCAITDLRTNTVTVVDAKSGEVQCIFGRRGNGPGEFQFVSGIRMDDSGNMLIADARRYCIQLFSPCGDFICMVNGIPANCFISDIHITHDYRLFIQERQPSMHDINGRKEKLSLVICGQLQGGGRAPMNLPNSRGKNSNSLLDRRSGPPKFAPYKKSTNYRHSKASKF